MPHTHWSRRDLMKRFGLAAALLSPILRVTRATAADPVKKRLVSLFKPIGFMPGDFWPAALTLGNTSEWSDLVLSPLEPHKADLTLIKGLEIIHPNGNPHGQGMARVFTGATVAIPPSGDAVDYGFPDDVSVDQAVAAYFRNTLGVTTPFRSLEFGVTVKSNLLIGRMAFDAPRQALQPGDDPGVMYDRIIAKITQVCGSGGDPSLRAREISLLDATRGDLNDAKVRLGLNSEERQKLERYQAAIQEIELGLQVVAPVSRPCPVGTRPTVVNTPANYDKISAIQIKLMLLALDWDLTRVCTLLWSGAQSGQVFGFLNYNGAPLTGAGAAHHSLTHAVRDSIGDNPRGKLKVIDTWYMSQVAALLEGMKTIDDGGGKTLLDNSVVFMGTEVADGATHSKRNMPFIVAGRGGGTLTSGKMHNLPAMRSHNDLLLTLCQALGMPITTFGEASKCTGPMSMLRA